MLKKQIDMNSIKGPAGPPGPPGGPPGPPGPPGQNGTTEINTTNVGVLGSNLANNASFRTNVSTDLLGRAEFRDPIATNVANNVTFTNAMSTFLAKQTKDSGFIKVKLDNNFTIYTDADRLKIHGGTDDNLSVYKSGGIGMENQDANAIKTRYNIIPTAGNLLTTHSTRGSAATAAWSAAQPVFSVKNNGDVVTGAGNGWSITNNADAFIINKDGQTKMNLHKLHGIYLQNGWEINPGGDALRIKKDGDNTKLHVGKDANLIAPGGIKTDGEFNIKDKWALRGDDDKFYIHRGGVGDRFTIHPNGELEGNGLAGYLVGTSPRYTFGGHTNDDVCYDFGTGNRTNCGNGYAWGKFRRRP